ncbi:MAG: 4-hydroxy-tetrahydrodipicolinate synthase [Acidimicrobiia bacterium]|nr:4-hydroxy-tetrahydrodipicolinate synthase [Acidimicrobiia bacterium]MDH5294019.1 4-hydroxy-tetrahydrodipicolinate synthase [Acidimicrobiia bacterium]
MDAPPFGAVLTAMVTPFGDDGAVDHGRLARLARFLVDNGSDGLVVTGTTGESPTLGFEEKLACYRTVVEAVGSRAVVVAGTGTYDTAESVLLSQRAADMGVAGLMAVTPYYSKPGQSGIRAHFEAIADATDLGVLVYNIPGRTGSRIELSTLAALAEHPNIVATKDAVMDLDFTSETVRTIPDLAVYSGQDSYTWPMMAVGAIGVVSVIAHLAGNEVKAMVTAALGGDSETARRLHQSLLPLCWTCFLETNPTSVKAAMSALWEPVGAPRLPLVPASAETVQAIKEAMTTLSQS